VVLIVRQEYSQSSGVGIQDNRALKFGVYANFNVQSSGAQEWAAESKRLSSIRTSNSTYNGSSHLGPDLLHYEHLEDLKSSNQSLSHSVRQRMAPNSLANRHASAEPAKLHMINRAAAAVSALASVVKDDPKPINRPFEPEVDAHWPNGSKFHASLPKISQVETILRSDDKATDGNAKGESECSPKETVQPPPTRSPLSQESKDARKALGTIYEKVLVVNDVKSARSVVQLLTTKYRNFIHACDTEVGDENPRQFFGLLYKILMFIYICHGLLPKSDIDISNQAPYTYPLWS
jgi:DNA polymerase-1